MVVAPLIEDFVFFPEVVEFKVKIGLLFVWGKSWMNYYDSKQNLSEWKHDSLPLLPLHMKY